MPNKSSKNGSARFWPTPDARDSQPGGFEAEKRRLEKYSTIGLQASAQLSMMTSSPSTEPTTPRLTCLQGDFLANLSVSPGSDSARQMTVRSGRKCSELLTAQSPVGSLVKTLLESSRWNSTISFLTWKASATPRGRLLFRLVPSMPDTDGTEFGSSQDAMWRTPQASEAGARVETLYTKEGEPARPGERAYRKQPDGRMVLQSVTIGQQVKMWPTPATRDYKGERGEAAQQRKGNPQDTLPNAVKMWHTPTSNEDAAGTPAGKMQAMLGNHPAIRGVTPEEWQRGSLNPNWVEWLMGYPKEWTVAESFASGRTKTSARQESAPESNIAPTDCVG